MYPKININLDLIGKNASYIKEELKNIGADIFFVSKLLMGDIKVAKVIVDSGINYIADSRIKNIIKMKNNGIVAEYVMLRIPALSEIEEVVKNTEMSLVSEIKTVEAINREAAKNNKVYKIIYMIDLGDLREGVWYEKAISEILSVKNFKNTELVGIGTNLGCFGGILPDEKNLGMLSEFALELKEEGFGIKFVSGGTTAVLKMVEEKRNIGKVNNFRLGESILLGTDATNGKNVSGCSQDTIILEAEIIELKEKPSLPVGEKGYDAFGRVPEFTDRGIRKKAILNIGEQDINPSGLIPEDKNAEVLHSSSDHTIVDVTESTENYEVGSIMKFRMNYGCALKASTSPYVEKNYISNTRNSAEVK